MCAKESIRNLQSAKWPFINQWRHIKKTTFPILEFQHQFIAWQSLNTQHIKKIIHFNIHLLQRSNPERLFTVYGEFPIGKKIVAVQFHPCLNKLQLLWWKISR
ncbi:hypothetical protein Cenrod_0478 [Candidatus Symbiobacter mobilis CR]|uniref:Uncharacterized protein n=1 Tax=Candidatus Symbiobacter mobilis CR TaxID=946483 RepID=U5N5G1_9BURK|nr:hypothetical protein Cenrod_0478 [Candidatus Symbiobacter mobilis CR]